MKTNRVPLLALLLLAIACATPASSGNALSNRVLPESVWGGEQETFTVLADRATFEGLCVDGAIEGNIKVDDAGKFTAAGTLRRRGGARIDDVAPAAVRYEGTIHGETLTLTIAGADGAPILTSTLTRGAHGTARSCA
jgi:hypothetical protein